MITHNKLINFIAQQTHHFVFETLWIFHSQFLGWLNFFFAAPFLFIGFSRTLFLNMLYSLLMHKDRYGSVENLHLVFVAMSRAGEPC